MKTIKQNLIAVFATLALVATAAVAAPTVSQTARGSNHTVIKQVRHELVTLPYYGVFDNLAYEVNGGTVTLSGQVTQPSTRSDAGRRIAKIAGIEKVVNNIEVLPLSSFDDSIRSQTYRAIFNSAGLYRYAMGANPSIHIIVNRGQLTLEGVVNNKLDKQLVYMAARRVFGAFSVTNNLRLENDGNQAS
jgi:hyperosmotically inducible protein